MGNLHGFDISPVVFKLMDRGLSMGQIDQAMKQLVGDDWKVIKFSTWRKRLQADDFLLQEHSSMFIDDLETLIKGRSMLNERLMIEEQRPKTFF